MKVIQKLAQAKAEIKNTSIKKEGKNEFAKYGYFTPSQVEHLVADVCEKNKLVTKFDLIRDTLGVYGKLTVYDSESGEFIEFQMATAIPEIKATNIAQQLGGCVTYTERYLKMTAFGIVDNNLDYDTDKPKESSPEQQPAKVEKEWLTEAQFNVAMASNIKGIESTLKVYNGKGAKAMKKEYSDKLNEKLKELKNA